jgi:hypothetical protein
MYNSGPAAEQCREIAELNGANNILVNGPGPDAPSTRSTFAPVLRRGPLWPYLIVCVLFLLLQILTRSPNLGDTVDYVDDIRSSASCSSIDRCPRLWDAGHLLWRPLGRFLVPPLLPLLNRAVGSDPRMQITLLLALLNGFAVLVAALLLYSILIKATGNVLVSLFSTLAFLCTNAGLYVLHSGLSYASGLAWLLGAVWFVQQESATGNMRFLGFAGLCGALAVSFWLPYLVALPALLCWMLLGRRNSHVQRAAVLIVSTAIAGGLLFGLGTHFRGVESVSDFRLWLKESGHGMEQNRNFIRSLFGFPRAFFDMGRFGVTMKQFLFKDPYANVKLGELWLSLWKVALFYVALGSLVALYRVASGRKALIIFGVALLANMAAAVAFEGGSPERYFPLYPFLFIAAALCLCLPQIPPVSRILVTLLFLVIVVGNLPGYSAARVHSEQAAAAQRLASLLPLRRGSYVYVVGADSIASFRRDVPFHEINRGAEFQIVGVYEPMVRTAHWKHDFASKVLSVWEHGGDIWVTTRVWSEQPRREWGWIEGDDPNLTWKDIFGFFRTLDHGPSVGGDDGFVLLMQSARNESILISLPTK